MQISDSLLRTKVRNYLQSNKFQNQIKQTVQYKKDLSMMWTDAELEQEISDLKREVKTAAVEITSRGTTGNSALSAVSPNNLLLHTITNVKRYASDPKYIQSCRVIVYFRPALLYRPSLYPRRFPKGVSNIVALRTNGWDYRRNQFSQVDTRSRYHGGIFGTWHGKFPVYARSFSYPRSDMFDAVSRHNSRMLRQEKPIHAQLSAKYMSVYGIGSSPVEWNKTFRPVGIDYMSIGLNFDFN